MRKVALFSLAMLLNGCSGLGASLKDTITLPGANPSMPDGNSENMERVKGAMVATPPILPENGDVWPGPPAPLPTLRDVEASPKKLEEIFSNNKSYFGSMASKTDGKGPLGEQLGDGENLNIGERSNIAHGVRPSLPSSVTDEANKFLEATPQGTVAIPNGEFFKLDRVRRLNLVEKNGG